MSFNLGGCNGLGNAAVTQRSSRVNNQKNSDVFTWNPPKNYEGIVTFYAVAVVSISEWYGKHNLIKHSVTLKSKNSDNLTSKPSYII